MFLRNMKSIIKYAIELDIDYLETFLGYEGDNVLKITMKSHETLNLLEKYITNLGLEYKTDYQIHGKNIGSHLLYIGVEDPSVFKLKKD